MRLCLIDDTQELVFDFPFTESAQEAWAVQWQRCDTSEAAESLRLRLMRQLDSVMVDFLDWDLKPPTAAQITYGTTIARDIGISLPAEALRYRGAMHEFIERHVEAFKKLGRT